jgi:serine/threonine-protein kinase
MSSALRCPACGGSRFKSGSGGLVFCLDCGGHLNVPQQQPETAVGEAGLTAGYDTLATADEDPATLFPAGYEQLGELGQGGMGIVYRARQCKLDREVALKVLRDRFASSSEAASRFLAEATITGRLAHPNIPPIHDVGTLPDGRPFLTMKLIEGRTLDVLLDERQDLDTERSKFVAIFEQICQAVAYAHAHNVIHRDLKPSNIMVGAFGEVQVMDWGLAKVLSGTSPAIPDEASSLDSVQRFLGGEPDADSDSQRGTQAGSVLGTPAYMAPEQAIGAVTEVDAHSDVFGLGAILAVILTGQPPYTGDTAESVRVLAARGALKECLARLDACWADPGLIALCKLCLSADRSERPANAGEVARAVAELRHAAEERARRAEVDWVRTEGELRAAEVQLAEQWKRRKVQAFLGLTFMALVLLGGASAWWFQEQRRAQEDEARERELAAERKTNQALEAAITRYGRARGARRDPALWAEARTAMLQAQSVAAAADAPAEMRERIGKLLAEIQQVEKTHRLVATLLDIQASMGDTVLPSGDQDFPGADARYEQAFRDYGTDLFRLSPEQGASLLRSLGSDLNVELAAALDDWAYVRYVRVRGMQNSTHLFQLTRLLDPDPLRNRIREAAAASDGKALRALAEEVNPAIQPVQTINLVAVYLYWFRKGDCADAIRFLRRAQPYHTGDFQIAHNLAYHLLTDGLAEQSIQYGTAAVAIRPRSAAAWADLARALHDSHRDTEAIAAYQQLVALAPKNTFPHLYLGTLFLRAREVAAALAAFQEAQRLDPTNRGVLFQVALAQEAWGDLKAALETIREILRTAANDPFAQHRRWQLEFALFLDPRLPAILIGEEEPRSPLEGCAFAELCAAPGRKQYAAAARLYTKAFSDDPTLLDDLNAEHRFKAARAAALAAAGQGIAETPLTPGARAALRARALGWLQAELGVWRLNLRPGQQQNRKFLIDKVSAILYEPDLAATKPGPGQMEMSAEERTRWGQFWTQLEVTLLECRRLP